MRRHLVPYIIMLAVFSLCMLLVLQFGARLEASANTSAQTPKAQASPSQSAPAESVPIWTYIAEAVGQNPRSPLSVLFVQIVVILVAAWGVGFLFHRFGQPVVMGEMLAGVMLGPSVLGMIGPEVEGYFFPPASFGTLNLLSQLGVVLFMFVVGLSLNLDLLRERLQGPVFISHASILLPFVLGSAFSLLLFPLHGHAAVSFRAFALFLGTSTSITAFPVLARIIEERGLARTLVGSTAIACAAVDDVTAWCILAVVLAMVRSEGAVSIALTLFLTMLYVGVMLLLVRPWLGSLLGDPARNGLQGQGLLVGVLAFAFASAFFTEFLGIHAIFGAFLAGVVLPRNREFQAFVKHSFEVFGSTILLPIFFAFTGLRTQINLLDGWHDWILCAGIIAIAISGKLLGSTLAARWTGMAWLDSAMIGTLMNARGLVELIALNIGYELGILSAKLFVMLVLMALTTTFMTGPLLSLIERWRRRLDQSATVFSQMPKVR